MHLDSGSLRGMPFSDGWVLERERITADHGGPRVRLKADGRCKDAVAIWRATTASRVVRPAAGVVRAGTHGLRRRSRDEWNHFRRRVQRCFVDDDGERLGCLELPDDEA